MGKNKSPNNLEVDMESIPSMLFNTLVNINNDVVAIFTSLGSLKFISPNIQQFLGYSKEELLNMEIYFLIHPLDLPTVHSKLEKLLSHDANHLSGIILRLRHKDNTWRWVDISATNFLSNRKVNGIFLHIRNINERASKIAKINEEIKILKKAVDHSQDVICVFDEQGKFIFVSRSCKQLWGYSPNELTGKPYISFVAKKDKKITLQANEQLLSGTILKHFENHYLRKDGTLVPVKWCAHYDLKEKKMYGVARNISGTRNINEAVKNREKRFRTLIQNSTDGLILLDKRGTILEISEPGKKILNFNSRAGRAKLRTNIHPEDMPLVNEAFFDVVNDPEYIKKIEYRYKIDENSHRWIEATFQNQYAEPEISAIVHNFRDITERKLSELKIYKSESLRRTIMNSTLDAIICIDMNGIVVLWNNKAEEMFGRKREEMLGKPLADLIIPSKYMRLYIAVVKHYLKTGRTDRMNRLFETTALDQNREEIQVELTVIPIEQEDELMFCAFIRDITERKKHEAEKEELVAKIERRAEELAISNAELEQFAYIASHDLQEPLRMVTSFLTQLEKKYRDQLDQKAQQYIHFATDGATRMRRIILDLLEYSRVGRRENDNEEVDVNEILEEVVSFHRITIKEKNAEVVWENLPTITGARVSFEQLFQNLVGNSLKYQKPGVKPKVEIRCKENGKYWIFSVADNGIGIDPKFFDKIFVLFQRLHQKEQYSGTGIGLAICKKIVETYGGKLWVESEPDVGTTFYFTIKK